MDYRYLGRTGIKVSSLCLGTAFRGQTDEQTSLRVIERAIELGCNFIDSALYGAGQSEIIVGKALKGKRDNVVLCTKIFGTIGTSPNHIGLSRVNLTRGVEASLKRLQTDYIDLYLMHAFDPHTPLEETLRTLDDMVHQGKVRYVGCSNFPVRNVMEALWISDRRNLEPFMCLQYQYNLLNRWEIEPDLMPICRQFGLGMMTYSPLAIGLLTGTFRRGQAPPPDSPWGANPRPGLSRSLYPFEEAMTEQADAIVQTLIDLGRKYGKTPAQVAIAWVLDHEEVTAPILGADLPEHVDDAFGAVGWTLEREDRALLDKQSEPQLPRKYA
jgi:aryl-alcohol dehydrogenase-like predicted oxidoreductase